MNISSREHEALDEWAEKQGLAPPPFPKSFSQCPRLLSGINTGDALLEHLSMDEVMAVVGNRKNGKIAFDYPVWCDRAAVKRGQKLFTENVFNFLASYLVALLHGFTIARFSEVLVLSGYTKSHWATYLRFRSTWLSIFRWGCYDTDSEELKEAITRVRYAHELARRAVRKKWPEDVGMPLSQYDMALVLMAFSGLALDVCQKECAIELSKGEREDFVALWRLLGYWLGVQDAYNVCDSLERAMAVFEEAQTLQPYFQKAPIPASIEMASSTIEGFGKYTLSSREHYLGLM